MKKEKVEIKWVKGRDMLADCLTKAGVKSDPLMTAIVTGSIKEFEEKVE